MGKKSVAFITIIALMLSILLVGCSGGSNEAAKDDEIKIGYIGPLTGDGAPWGIAQVNMLKMLVEDTNANGGLLGKKVVLFYYDNRSDSVETSNAAKRLIQQDKVNAIIGTNSSSTSIAMASICEDNKVPMIATNATNAQVTMKDAAVRPYTFRIILTDPQLGSIMANYTYNELNIKNVAMLYELGSDYSIGVKDAFKESFEKLGGKITTSEAYKTGDVDFRAQLSKIKETNPEAIFLPALYKQIGLAANQARQLGITAKLVGTDSWTTKDIITLAADAVEGSYLCTSMNIKDPALDGLKKKYDEKYNQKLEDMGSDGFMAYDAYMVLLDAINRAGSADSVAIRDALETTKDVKGCIGSISINAEDHNPEREAFIMTIENKDYKVVNKYKP